MTAMFMARFPLQRLIAALLPMSFLWLIVACVSHCSWEGEEHHECHSSFSSFEVTYQPASDDCPITDVPKAMIPQRAMPDLQTTLVVQHAIHPGEPSLLIVPFNSWSTEPSFSDPPLERLPTLRI